MAGVRQPPVTLYLQGSLTQNPPNAAVLTGSTVNTAASSPAPVVDTSGYNGTINVEIQELLGGTATVTITGSFDGITFYNVGYYQVDNNASLARSVGGISVLANAKHVYQILDPYPYMKATISAIASASIVARAYCVPE